MVREGHRSRGSFRVAAGYMVQGTWYGRATGVQGYRVQGTCMVREGHRGSFRFVTGYRAQGTWYGRVEGHRGAGDRELGWYGVHVCKEGGREGPTHGRVRSAVRGGGWGADVRTKRVCMGGGDGAREHA